jgi:predicted aspartyl protease
MRWATVRLGLIATALRVCLGASLPVPATNYHIKLDSFAAPSNPSVGLLIRARINDGPSLRLLLDSGSQYIVLDRKAAVQSVGAGGADIDLVGAGASSAAVGKSLRADTLRVGDLTFRDVPLVIADRRLSDGIQGVFPLALFAEYLIRLDVLGKALDLSPYPPEPPDPSRALPVFSNNQLLLVKATANESHEGYFLVDTGAAYTAISRNLASHLKVSEALASRVPLAGGIAEMQAPVVTGLVRLQLATAAPVSGPMVAVDLSTLSRYQDLEVSGLIGFSALHNSILTVSYRNRLLWITPSKPNCH